MYETGPDPYCYPRTNVLKKRLDIRDHAQLEKAEAQLVELRSREPLPLAPGKPGRTRLTYRHYLAIHRHLFGDVYSWAGRLRTVRLTKGASTFCYPEHIDREMLRIFRKLADANELRDLEPDSFAAGAATLLSELNAIHPFREGNGRTQNIFLDLLASRAGHPLDMSRIATERLDVIGPMVAAFNGHERPLAELIVALMRRSL